VASALDTIVQTVTDLQGHINSLTTVALHNKRALDMFTALQRKTCVMLGKKTAAFGLIDQDKFKIPVIN
jgi:hypothetical protein